MKNFALTVLTLVSILLSACGPNAGTTTIELQETAAQITEVTQEIISMNNCGGKADAKQTAIRSKIISVDLGGSVGINKGLAEGEVTAKYSQANASSKSIELVAPPGTNMEFTIEWTDSSWIGIVVSQQTNEKGSYKVSVPVSVALIGSKDLGNCPNTTNTKATCPYQGNSDLQTFRNLKLAEQEAVISKNMDVIKTIFTKDAVLESVSENIRWTNAEERYQESFTTADVKYINLTDFQILKQEDNRAWVTEKDSGAVIFRDSKEEFQWVDATAHIIFSKTNGCWQISYFAFDAESQSFP